jgi:hypothetical protein
VPGLRCARYATCGELKRRCTCSLVSGLAHRYSQLRLHRQLVVCRHAKRRNADRRDVQLLCNSGCAVHAFKTPKLHGEGRVAIGMAWQCWQPACPAVPARALATARHCVRCPSTPSRCIAMHRALLCTTGVGQSDNCPPTGLTILHATLKLTQDPRESAQVSVAMAQAKSCVRLQGRRSRRHPGADAFTLVTAMLITATCGQRTDPKRPAGHSPAALWSRHHHLQGTLTAPRLCTSPNKDDHRHEGERHDAVLECGRQQRVAHDRQVPQHF